MHLTFESIYIKGKKILPATSYWAEIDFVLISQHLTQCESVEKEILPCFKLIFYMSIFIFVKVSCTCNSYCFLKTHYLSKLIFIKETAL